MAPPRLQCLNSGKYISSTSAGLKAAFSTSRIARAEDGSRPSPADFLDSLPAAPPRPGFPSPSIRPPPMYQKVPRQESMGQKPQQFKRVQPGNAAATERIMRWTQRANEDQARRNNAPSVPGETSHVQSLQNEFKDQGLAKSLSMMITRRYKAGDVYAPHDLSSVEATKWKRRNRPLHDAFDVLDMNPLDHYRNFSIMSEYMTDMGRIKHSKDTGLRPVNQRRIAKAIRRSIGMGLMPSVHKHPEILQKQMQPLSTSMMSGLK